MDDNILSYEKFLTINTQVKAALSSRPLCQLSNDPNDVEILISANFIIDSPLIGLLEPNYTELLINQLSRWQ